MISCMRLINFRATEEALFSLLEMGERNSDNFHTVLEISAI